MFIIIIISIIIIIIIIIIIMFCSVYLFSSCKLALFGYPDRGFSVLLPQL